MEGKDEEYLDLYLTQHRKGILVRARAHPDIENFFKSRSSRQGYSSEYAGLWTDFNGVTGEYVPIYVTPGGFPEVHNPAYTLELPGGDFTYDDRINLSFLRTAGISESAGVKFFVNTPISVQALRDLKDDIGKAVRTFVYEHLTPITVHLTIISRKDLQDGSQYR